MPLSDLDRRVPEGVVAREVGRRALARQPRILTLDRLARLLLRAREDGPNAGWGRGENVEAAREQGALTIVGADDQRDARRSAVLERVERTLWQKVAVDHGAERDGARVAIGRRERELRRRLDEIGCVGTRQQLARVVERGRLDPGRLDAVREKGHELVGPELRLLRRVDGVRRGALRDGLGEQPSGGWGGHQGGHGIAARRLTEHRHVRRIAPEGRDIRLHPLERRHLVAQSEVVVEHPLRCREPREVEVAEGAQTIVDADVDDAAFAHERLAVERVLGARAHRVGTAVNEDHHGKARRFGVQWRTLRPHHVEGQTVLAHDLGLARTPEVPLQRLPGDGSVLRCVPHAAPRLRRQWRPESPVADGRGRIGKIAPELHPARSPTARHALLEKHIDGVVGLSDGHASMVFDQPVNAREPGNQHASFTPRMPTLHPGRLHLTGPCAGTGDEPGMEYTR
ncbi:conserved protein of unknown function [Agreia sp. COWG]|nr:conserved protein of unknown function [Agreia sp. COWG]